jgi:hypothetical protein
MPKELSKDKKTFFELVEGSNYEVLMTYDRSEIIEFEQFKKLMPVLNDSNITFVSINKRIVNKSGILDMNATKKLTPKQKELAEKEMEEYLKKQERKGELENIKRAFDAKDYNEKFGVGKWTKVGRAWVNSEDPDDNIGHDGIVHIETREIAGCWEAFEKAHPLIAKELKELS